MTERAEIIRAELDCEYPSIKEFFGDIIEQKLRKSHTDGMLTGHLFDERSAPDLAALETTLSFGEENCEGFGLIFQDYKLFQYKDVDAKIIDMLAEVKAFEFLSERRFRDITKVEQKQGERSVDFIAHKSGESYALVVARLISAQYVEEHSNDYDIGVIKDGLATDIANTIDQQYPQIKEFCQRKIGTWRGIIFISSGRDYFGDKRYKNKLYGLRPSMVTVVLNREWRERKEGRESHKYLHHIVITTGQNISRAIVYPSL